jgi:hypothetical protein
MESYSPDMSASSLSPEDIRAAAEVHQELGPEYSDAVMASFLEKVDKEIAARVEARLATTRPAEPVKLDGRRMLLTGIALGAAIAGVPLILIAWHAAGQGTPPSRNTAQVVHAASHPAFGLLILVLVTAAVCAVAAIRARQQQTVTGVSGRNK